MIEKKRAICISETLNHPPARPRFTLMKVYKFRYSYWEANTWIVVEDDFGDEFQFNMEDFHKSFKIFEI